jgi:hypothetical protein
MKAFGVISIVGTALAVVMTIASCSSSSSSPAPSGPGESCTRTSDCQSGFLCLGDVCIAKGGGVVVVPDAGTSDADAGEASAPVVSARLGTSCSSTAECNDPSLTCVPSTLGGIKGGICDLTSFGITPTNKVCGECAQASDCCELPFNFVQSTNLEAVDDAGNFFVVRTCSDLLNFVIGGNTAICGTTTVTQVIEACNAYAHYCNGCVVDSWSCNSGQCAYTGPCAVGASTFQWNSCPTLTRAGRALNLRCVGDAGATGTCTSGACQTSADCPGQIPLDLNGINTCEGTDCVCFQNACYFACATDLDCPGGYTCDATNKVCTRTGCIPGAGADTTCKVQLADSRAHCQTVNGLGTCTIPCTGDHDCSPFSGAVPGTTFNPARVCGPDGFCVSVAGGCSSDGDCRTTSNSVNGFCVAAPPAAAVRSAIANH